MIFPQLIPRAFSVFAAAALLGTSAAAQMIDQSQPTFTHTGDIASSGKSGQTFTAGLTGSLLGVRLLVEAKGFSNSAVFGSDFVFSLRSTTNGTPDGSVLAIGNFSRSQLQRDVPRWITVTFNTPYHQSAGEVLAFTIQELSGGGADGYNAYGNADGNLYSPGQVFFTYTPGQPLTPSTRDFAFETVVVPEPASFGLLGFGAVGLLLFRARRVSMVATFRI